MRWFVIGLAASFGSTAWAQQVARAPVVEAVKPVEEVEEVEEVDEANPDAIDELQVRVAELEAAVRRLEARKPVEAPPPLRIWEGDRLTKGDQWCHLVDLAPGEVMVAGLWLDDDGRWNQGEVVGAGFAIAQRGDEVGFRHLAPCATLARGFRVVIGSP